MIPFRLSDQPQDGLDKLLSEALDKTKAWEKKMEPFFGESREAADSWRMIPRAGSKKPSGFFNSKSGETNRATNTLATMWFRMITASDPIFEARRQGLDEFMQEIPEDGLFAVEGVISRQLQVLQFKRKLLKSLRSLALFGTTICEEPFVSLPTGNPNKSFEGTDFVFRSLLQTGFDPYVFDMDMSDYLITIDYPTKWKLRDLADNATELWDKEAIEGLIHDQEQGGENNNFETETWERIQNRKQRAGYEPGDKEFHELITYHGRLDTDNPVLQAYWQSQGRTDDIRFSDFTISILNGKKIVRLHATPYGSWRHIFKTAHANEFELEPVGYGVGKLGKKLQREIDVTQSRSGDALAMNLYAMWKVSKYAGLKASDLNIKPWGIIEMEDINQLEQVKTDINTVVQALAMMGVWKEDFRTITGATTNLQAAITKATATEASLTQNEAIRGNSVIAEIIAETFIRSHIETCHINNTDLLDNEIFVELAGQDKPTSKGFNRHNLPKNIGFRILTTTDKDFRPERIKNLLQLLQVVTSVRQMVPDTMNLIRPALMEIAHGLGINPREFNRQKPIVDQMIEAAKAAQGNASVGNAVAGEVAGAAAGDQANSLTTPVGPVPTSPNASSLVQPI